MHSLNFHIPSKLFRILAIVLAAQIIALGVLAFWRVPSASASPNFSFTQLAWNVIGLDSNKVTDGPNEFPVAWRICNTSGLAMTNVTATFTFDTVNAYVSLSSSSSESLGSLAIGGCADAYFVVVITRDANAYFTSRDYHVSATATSVSSESGPTRTLYVEKLVSQNRNGTYSPFFWSGPSNVTVGQQYNFGVKAFTATGGYRSWESFVNFPTSAFQIVSATVTYPQPSTTTQDRLWVNACTWVEATRTCTNSNDGGGDPDWITYTVRIVTAGTYTVHNTVYDFSGSSYHYNSDYATVLAVITSTTPTSADLLYFKARRLDDPTKVRVKWETGTEVNVLGFRVWRKTLSGNWKPLGEGLVPAKYVGQIGGGVYKFVDKTAKPGKTYRYKLEVANVVGGSQWSEVVKVQ